MERRKFLSLLGGAFALSFIPANLAADDYRKLKPNVWTAHTVEDGIKNLYGTTNMIESKDVKIKMSKINSSGGAVPVKFSTKIPAKTVALFQDANPESAVAVYSVGKYDITDYEVKIKLGPVGTNIATVTVVVEGLDGKLYTAKLSTEVAAGGCEG